MTKKQESGSSTAGAQADKVKVESLEVFGGTCSRGAWRQFFEATGENSRVSWFKAELSTQKCVCSRNLSETWALPITVSVAVVAYAVLAAVFYNMDV